MLPFFQDYLTLLENLHQDMAKAITGVPVEGLDWAPMPDTSSLSTLVMHSTGAERFLIGEIAGGEPSGRVRDAEFQLHGLDENALKQRLADSLAYNRTILERLTYEDLGKERYSEQRQRTYNIGWALAHALEHTGVHVGHAQLTRQMWDARSKQ